MVKTVFSEDKAREHGITWPSIGEDKTESHMEPLSGTETHIYLLKNPILVGEQDEPRDILSFRNNNRSVRIYPPFIVNEQGETSGAFKGVMIPEGMSSVERMVEIPTDAVTGLRSAPGENSKVKWCRGFRLDVESGANGFTVLQQLLDHITQFTHQWWIRAVHDPQLGPARFGGTIAKDFRILQTARQQGAGKVEATWYGTLQRQRTLGFGTPLANGKWLLAGAHTQDGKKADQGLLSFYDGMASYMAGQDDKCILNLSIAVEIMLSKHSVAIQKKEPSTLEKALRKTTLIDDRVRDILFRLKDDRNSVAHGRQPFILTRDKRYTLEMYLSAVTELVHGYLHSIPFGAWPEIMDLTLEDAKVRIGKAGLAGSESGNSE